LMDYSNDFLCHLPQEIFGMHIFPLLSVHDIAMVSSVCKEWHGLASRNTLWSDLFKQKYSFHIQGPLISAVTEISYKNLYQLCLSLQTSDDIPDPPIEWEKSAKDFVTHLKHNLHGSDVFVHVAAMATPLFYRFDCESGRWSWTPDWSFWMECNTTVVTGGFWDGEEPVRANVELIKWLDQVKPRPIVISQHLTVVKKRR